jgi:putative acetyltransferase
MFQPDIVIGSYQDQFREQLLYVWEQSVIATHSFLNPEDFESIKLEVAQIDFNQFRVYCLLQGAQVLGFIGVAEQKIEMLFMDPAYIGQGLGYRLLRFAINQLHAIAVDVNEQNLPAVLFYQKAGFETYERTELDDQGRHYPLLRMRLKGLEE